MRIKNLKFAVSILILLSVFVYGYKEFISSSTYTVVNAIAPSTIKGIVSDNLGVVSYLLSNKNTNREKIANALNVTENKNIRISTQLVSGVLILKVSGPDKKNISIVSKSIVNEIIESSFSTTIKGDEDGLTLPRRLLYSINSIIYEDNKNSLLYALSIFLLGLIALLYFRDEK